MGVVGVAINVMPALANGIVYVGADDGKLYAFALPD
jgi:outer membrane protein assembly factor BamB